MDMFANGFSLPAFFAMLRRRKWLGISSFLLTFSTLASVIWFLPNIYMSQAVILVESQQIPQEYIRSTVTKVVGRRLQEISQEILGRSQLEKLANQFHLYRDLKAEGASSETIAKAMRKDIGIQVVNGKGSGGDTVAFALSYRSQDQAKAMHVTTELASLYIATNMQMRERQAASTSEFLAKKVEEVKAQLEKQENTVTAYKREHLGELPEQREANLGMIDALQKQMGLLSDNLARAQERRNAVSQMAALEAELVEVEEANFSMSSGKSSASSLPLSPAQQKQALERQLAQLKVRFSDKHPDVIRLKQLITNIENEPGILEQSLNSGSSPGDAAASSLRARQSHARASATKATTARIELSTIDNEIQRINGELRKVSADISMYQRRIENTPRVEQELLSTTRDYNTTQDLYASLLKRLDEAKLADSLEQNQKAEKFKLLEPAFYPDKPAAPERERLLALALFLSLGVAIGGSILWEMVDSSFHNVEDLRRQVKVPVLISIPRIVTTAELWRGRLRQGIGIAALTLSVLVIVGILYRVVPGNESLTRTLLRSGGPNQLLLRE